MDCLNVISSPVISCSFFGNNWIHDIHHTVNKGKGKHFRRILAELLNLNVSASLRVKPMRTSSVQVKYFRPYISYAPNMQAVVKLSFTFPDNSSPFLSFSVSYFIFHKLLCSLFLMNWRKWPVEIILLRPCPCLTSRAIANFNLHTQCIQQ